MPPRPTAIRRIFWTIDAGIDHYVLKPVDINKFIGAIYKCSRDILVWKALEQYHLERENLITELQAAIEEIKTLRGILPICSYCNDIRNDEGYWGRVDAYIARHTEVDFSHSICPSCLKKHYPEYYERVMKDLDATAKK